MSIKALTDHHIQLQKLHSIIKRRSYQTGTFQLTSGKSTNHYFQLQHTTIYPPASFLIGHLVATFMARHNLSCIGGLEYGAVPIVTATAAASYLVMLPIETFCVRKEQKQHGAQQLINGRIPSPNTRVLIVDDVATTGSSILKAHEHVKFFNCSALVLIDRQEGAAGNLGNRGIPLYSFFHKSDFK